MTIRGYSDMSMFILNAFYTDNVDKQISTIR